MCSTHRGSNDAFGELGFRVQSVGLGVQHSAFRFHDLNPEAVRIQGSGFMIETLNQSRPPCRGGSDAFGALGYRVLGLGFRIQRSGFMI